MMHKIWSSSGALSMWLIDIQNPSTTVSSCTNRKTALWMEADSQAKEICTLFSLTFRLCKKERRHSWNKPVDREGTTALVSNTRHTWIQQTLLTVQLVRGQLLVVAQPPCIWTILGSWPSTCSPQNPNPTPLLVHPIQFLALHQEIKEACTYCTTKRALHRTTKSPFSQSIPPSEESMCMHPSLTIILIMSVVKSSGSQPGSILHIHHHILLLFPLRIADHKSTRTCIEKIQWQHTIETDFQRKQLGNKQKCILRTTTLSTADQQRRGHGLFLSRMENCQILNQKKQVSDSYSTPWWFEEGP